MEWSCDIVHFISPIFIDKHYRLCLRIFLSIYSGTVRAPGRSHTFYEFLLESVIVLLYFYLPNNLRILELNNYKLVIYLFHIIYQLSPSPTVINLEYQEELINLK